MKISADESTRPVWAEVSASALRHNLQVLRETAGAAAPVLAVIKADAYGHGAAACAPVLAGAGAAWLGVTSVDEGARVRRALAILPQGMQPRVLVMCGLWPGEEAMCLDRGLTPVVWEPYHLDLLEAEAKRRNTPPGSVAVHVEIDTGMARQGVPAGDLLRRLLARFTPASPLRMEGVLTHMASAECAADAQNELQWSSFGEALRQAAEAGVRPRLVHVGNTSGIDSGAVAQRLHTLAEGCGAAAMTRAGMGVYGYALEMHGATAVAEPLLRPALAWKTRVVSVREIAAGATVGYNATFVARRPMRLALLPVGYADGLRRALSSSNLPAEPAGGAVWIRDTRCPVVGRVSMDLTTVDVSALPGLAIGEEVQLLGPAIPAGEHAALAATSVYEVLCGISDRVPRIVVD